MALYELGSDKLSAIKQTTFADAKVKEREDLQRLLRTQIQVLDPDLYVLAEEFDYWEDSSRRIDLLAIDSDAQLVVIELKRTEDGGHMELQAIRYAAMVSAMTWEQAVEAHRKFLLSVGIQDDAGQVTQIVAPVNIFEVDNLETELEGIEGTAAKADFIASRVKKTCIEKMEEDPVLYKKLSEVIDEAIQDYLEKRLSEQAYFQKMYDAWNVTKEQGASNVPAELRSDPEAQAYFRLFREGFQKVAGSERDDLTGIAAETALKARRIIEDKKIRDWVGTDVEKAMVNDLDDLLFAAKGRYDLPLTSDDIDEILEGIMRVTVRREMQ